MKVKVKIAVAVTGAGKWSSCGYQSDEQRDEPDMIGLAMDGLDTDVGGEAVYWLTAELDVPEAQSVEAAVERVK